MKETKRGLFDRIKKFLREVRAELKKVAWPNRRETVSFTSVVVLSVVGVAFLVWVMDVAFSFVLRLALKW